MKIKSLIVASLAAVSFAAPAFAGETTVSYNVGAASDYIWRGISQTNSDPEIFAGADISSGPLYAGIWGSNVGFAAGTEVDLYAGFKPTLGPVTFDLGILSYNYPGEGSTWNAVEYKAGISGNAGPVALSFTDYYNTGAYNYYEAAASAPFGKAKVGPFALSGSATFGKYVYVGTAKDYTNYKLAVTGTAENGVAVEVGFTDTNLSRTDYTPYKDVKGRAYLLLKKNF